jgi:hypothetical protein
VTLLLGGLRARSADLRAYGLYFDQDAARAEPGYSARAVSQAGQRSL